MTELLSTVADFVLAASLKGSALILLVLAIQYLTRDLIPARWRHAMWLLVFLRLVIPAAPQSPVSLFNLSRAFGSPKPHLEIALTHPLHRTMPRERVAIVPAEEVSYRREPGTTRVAAGLAILSAAGLIVFLLRLLVTSIKFGGLRNEGIIPPRAIELLEECKRRLRVRAPVRLIETDHVATPALHGVVRPTLLMPRGFLDRFSTEELRFIFLHELAHLRRSDVLVNCAVSAIAVLHWFNPLVWLATRRVNEERELACDEMSLACLQQEERPEYGRTILKLLEMFRPVTPLPAVLGILSDKDQIRRRLTMITRFRSHPRSTFFFLALLLGLGAVSLTDARAGEKLPHMKRIGPAERATLQKLEVPVTVTLTNASLTELLNALSAQTGVNIVQSAEVAASPVQQRRITIDADRFLAHAVLMETLIPLDLSFEPTADGIVVNNHRSVRRMFMFHGNRAPGEKLERRIVLNHADVPAEVEDEIEVETNGSPAEAQRVIAFFDSGSKEGENGAEELDERVFIRKVPADQEVAADGTIRRNIKMKLNRNGMESTGSMRLEISPAQ